MRDTKFHSDLINFQGAQVIISAELTSRGAPTDWSDSSSPLAYDV
jgi:hypothetical protein